MLISISTSKSIPSKAIIMIYRFNRISVFVLYPDLFWKRVGGIWTLFQIFILSASIPSPCMGSRKSWTPSLCDGDRRQRDLNDIQNYQRKSRQTNVFLLTLWMTTANLITTQNFKFGRENKTISSWILLASWPSKITL